MNFEPVSMTMPSADCPTPFSQPPKAFVLDRLKQRVSKYERHGQECAERYSLAQHTIRANEKLDTARLWQRVQDNAKNKKGAKCRMDARPKVASIDPTENDNGYQGLPVARVGPSLKRKMPMGGETRDGHVFGDANGPQQEAKKMKNDQPTMNGNQRPEYQLPSVSVQIVQNFGGEPTNQIETTVNVHSNRNMPDSQSVRVNVDSKNIKQETDGRRGQQPQQPQQMGQQNMNQCSAGSNDADLGGFLEEDLIPGADDLDLMLDDIFEQMPEVMENLDRDLMTPDTQRHPTPMSQQQQMPSQSPQMPPSQPHHHNVVPQSHHPMTSQSPQMMSPPHSHHMTSQSPQMSSHPHHQHMSSQSPRLASQSHQQHVPSQSPRIGTQQMHHHNMPSQSPQIAPQYPQQHHMTSHPQHMTSPLRHMSSPPVQHMSSPPMMQQSARMVCKREKVDMYHGFRGNTPENKQEPQGLPRQNSMGMTQQNISANIVNRQSVQITGGGNFSANLSSQQNISLNVMQQNNFNGNSRMMPSNNNSNMTSQHIHRLNQVAQFGPREPTPTEPSRMYHPPANSHAPSQPNYYESHSQHLKQLAEKRSYGMNPGSGPMNMTHDPRSAQHFPPHFRGDGPPPPMTQQQMSVPTHPHHHHHQHHHHHHNPNMPPSGGQRMASMDANVYSRSSSQFVQTQRPGMNVVMQQSEAMVMKQYQMQPNQHPSYYNRVPEPRPQLVMSSNPNPGYQPGSGPHPSWNSRGAPWSHGSHAPLHRGHVNPEQRTHMPQDHRPHMNPDHMRPQVTPDHMRPPMNSELAPSNFFPEIDNNVRRIDMDNDLNIIEEILSKTNA